MYKILNHRRVNVLKKVMPNLITEIMDKLDLTSEEFYTLLEQQLLQYDANTQKLRVLDVAYEYDFKSGTIIL